MFGGFNPFPNKKGQQRPLGVVQNQIVEPFKKSGAGPCPAGPTGSPGKPGKPGNSSPPPLPKANQAIEAAWNGVIHGWSGYAKANRELLRELSAYGAIRFADDAWFDPSEKESAHLGLYQYHRDIPVSEKAPRITFMPPPPEDKGTGYKVIYTMMETEPKCHPDMIRIMNERYDECWTPTAWNAGTFSRSGLKIPIRVMPLGVDASVYHPRVEPFLPKAIRMTGADSGRSEVPKGFLFINVFQPSFRKGHDVLIEVFEETFGEDPEVGLVLGTTAYSLEDQFPWKSMRSRIWTLPGGYSERQLASTYKGCQVYVTASRAEGWNLPLGEAGAVGLPVICPRVTSHPEVVPKGCGYFFEKDSTRIFPGQERVSPWFSGFEFADYGPKSRRQLAMLMAGVRKNYGHAQKVGMRYREHIVSTMTWNHAARKIAERLRVICSKLHA